MSFDETQEGRDLRDEGIATATESAERANPSWAETAFTYLQQWLRLKGSTRFQSEELVKWAHEVGLVEPPNKKAWGGVIQKASRKQLITRVGYGQHKNKKSHACPSSIWQQQ